MAPFGVVGSGVCEYHVNILKFNDRVFVNHPKLIVIFDGSIISKISNSTTTADGASTVLGV